MLVLTCWCGVLFCSALRQEALLCEAEKGRREVLGPRHRDALTSIDNVGRLLQRQGRLTEAEPLLREAEAGRREMMGERHREALLSLDHLGGLLHDDGKLAEAVRRRRIVPAAQSPTSGAGG